MKWLEILRKVIEYMLKRVHMNEVEYEHHLQDIIFKAKCKKIPYNILYLKIKKKKREHYYNNS